MKAYEPFYIYVRGKGNRYGIFRHPSEGLSLWCASAASIFYQRSICRYAAQRKTICAAVPRGNAYYVDDVLSSGSLSDIIDALQVIGATQYATLILEIIQRDFCGVQFPLNEAQMTQMQAKLDRAEQKIGDAPGAYDELRKAMARYMMARLNTSENIY